MATDEYIAYRIKSAQMDSLYRPIAISKTDSYSESIYFKNKQLAMKYLRFYNFSDFNECIKNKCKVNDYYVKEVSIKEYLQYRQNSKAKEI